MLEWRPMDTLDRIAGLDKFYVQQKFAPMVNHYRIATVGADGTSEGEPLANVKQKRMKIREQVDFFAGDEQSTMAMQIKARGVFEFRGRSDVRLPDGTVIGQLQKDFSKSLLRSTWHILDAEGEAVASAQESSMPIAVLRRVWGWIPLASVIPFPLPFHFDITIDDKTVGTYRRQMSIMDRYIMDLSGDTERRIDRRVAAAFAIALDALQDR